MAEVLEAITASGQSTCGREVNFRIGVTQADVILRELDPATNRYVEVVQVRCRRPSRCRRTIWTWPDDPTLRVPGDAGRGRDQLAGGRCAEAGGFPGRAQLETVPPEGTLAPGQL